MPQYCPTRRDFIKQIFSAPLAAQACLPVSPLSLLNSSNLNPIVSLFKQAFSSSEFFKLTSSVHLFNGISYLNNPNDILGTQEKIRFALIQLAFGHDRSQGSTDQTPSRTFGLEQIKQIAKLSPSEISTLREDHSLSEVGPTYTSNGQVRGRFTLDFLVRLCATYLEHADPAEKLVHSNLDIPDKSLLKDLELFFSRGPDFLSSIPGLKLKYRHAISLSNLHGLNLELKRLELGSAEYFDTYQKIETSLEKILKTEQQLKAAGAEFSSIENYPQFRSLLDSKHRIEMLITPRLDSRHWQAEGCFDGPRDEAK